MSKRKPPSERAAGTLDEAADRSTSARTGRLDSRHSAPATSEAPRRPASDDDANLLPDVRQLMQDISRAAGRIPPDEGRRAAATVVDPLPPPPRGLDDNWDVWRLGPVRSHRGLLGVPLVLAKRASLLLLRLHDRELLKRQREFNRAVRDELRQLREHVARLSRGGGDDSGA